MCYEQKLDMSSILTFQLVNYDGFIVKSACYVFGMAFAAPSVTLWKGASMKTDMILRSLGMFATALAVSAASQVVLAVPTPAVCPDSNVVQTQTDLTAAGTTTTINGAVYTSVDTNG